jgi:hypothetical protein
MTVRDRRGPEGRERKREEMTTSLQKTNLRTRMRRTPVTPMAKVSMEERRKHHHFRSRRHSSSSGIWTHVSYTHVAPIPVQYCMYINM